MKFIQPQYQYFKVIPNYSVRNQQTYKIARAINSLYRNLFQRVQKQKNNLTFMAFEKVSYFIYMEKHKVEFYFILPQKHKEFLLDKMNDAWDGVTIKEVQEIPVLNINKWYGMRYTKEDAMSLAVDRRNNDLLKSILNTIHVMEEQDKAGIFYNFIPTFQFSWKNEYKQTIEKIKNGEPIDKDKSKLSYLFKYGVSSLSKMVNELSEVVTEKKVERHHFIPFMMDRQSTLSNATIQKEFATVLNVQIAVMNEGNTDHARTIAQSFESISEGNSLKPILTRGKWNHQLFKIKAPTNKMSDMETQNFISLCGREILEEFNFIDKVETKETKVPEELQNGTHYIGINTYRGNKQKAYLCTDKEYKNLVLMLIGPTRAGKSTLIQNLARDSIQNDECVFLFDFIKNCELSQEVAELFPKEKVLKIECSDFDHIQGLGYNEVGNESEPFKQYDNAKKQTTQLMTLINSINQDEAILTAKMERYLTSASLITFISQGSIKDVFDVLQNRSIRNTFIQKVPKNQYENLLEYMENLYTLDEKDREGNVIGTKYNLIAGIIDRLNKLKANTFMELMLRKGIEHNFNLVDELQKNQLICLQMSEDMFSTDSERDIYTTYWMTKLWLALQMRARKIPDRAQHKKVNMVIDEIYQVSNTEKFLTEKLSRLAKFSVKPIISCHYINQLKYMRNELRSANASYMLISGCDKNNFHEFKEELYPYQMDDLLNLKRYHSLNILKYSAGYAKFITKLPNSIYKPGKIVYNKSDDYFS